MSRETIRKSKRKTVKKNKSNYKITIHKKNFSDSLYKYFKLIRINPKHNLSPLLPKIKMIK